MTTITIGRFNLHYEGHTLTSLNTNNSVELLDKVVLECISVMALEIIKMRELLHAVSTQYAETGVDDIKRDKPIINILKYIESLFK